MKKAIILLAVILSGTLAFGQCKWQAGVQLAFGGNQSQFSGGMDQADATFNHNEFGVAAWRINFQRKFSEHWYGQIGIGTSKYGFQDAISKDYSFLNMDKRWTGLGTAIHQFDIPVTGIFKFREDCRNRRWFVGAGLTFSANNKDIDITKTASEQKGESLASDANLTQHVTGGNYAVVNPHFMAGLERRFKRGALLNAGFYWNPAWQVVANSEVTYTIDGTDYNHTFANRGAWGGFMMNYYFTNHCCKKRGPLKQ